MSEVLCIKIHVGYSGGYSQRDNPDNKEARVLSHISLTCTVGRSRGAELTTWSGEHYMSGVCVAILIL